MQATRVLLVNCVNPYVEAQNRYPALGLGYLVAMLNRELGDAVERPTDADLALPVAVEEPPAAERKRTSGSAAQPRSPLRGSCQFRKLT